jgi:hypothetical protein
VNSRPPAQPTSTQPPFMLLARAFLISFLMVLFLPDCCCCWQWHAAPGSEAFPPRFTKPRA